MHVKYHNIHVVVQNTIASTSNANNISNAIIDTKERNPYNILVFLRTSGWSDIVFTDIVVKRAHTNSDNAIPITPPYNSSGEITEIVMSFSNKYAEKQIHSIIRISNFSSSFIIL